MYQAPPARYAACTALLLKRGEMKVTLLLTSMVLGLLVCGVAWGQGAASADATPPRVTRTVPVPGMTCVDPAANLSAYFSEEVQASSVDGATVRLYRKDSGVLMASSVRYGGTRNRAILDPAEPLEGGVAYKAVVGTGVLDLAGNPLDQNATRTGLQPKTWSFTTSASSEAQLDCQQTVAQADLRNAANAATVCAADSIDASYVNCATVAQLKPYGFEPTVGVTFNGMHGNAYDWSAATQHKNGGSAYTFATFGADSGQVVEAPRGTGAPALPDRIAEWEALAQVDTRNAAVAANAYAADHNGSYRGISLAGLVSEGFVQSPGVTTTIVDTTPNYVVIESEHAYGGRAYQYDSRNGQFGFVPR